MYSYIDGYTFHHLWLACIPNYRHTHLLTDGYIFIIFNHALSHTFLLTDGYIFHHLSQGSFTYSFINRWIHISSSLTRFFHILIYWPMDTHFIIFDKVLLHTHLLTDGYIFHHLSQGSFTYSFIDRWIHISSSFTMFILLQDLLRMLPRIPLWRHIKFLPQSLGHRAASMLFQWLSTAGPKNLKSVPI